MSNLRTYGKIYAGDGSYKWVEVQTDSGGDSSYVWITTLIQTLKLNLGESPFFANYGIPARPTIVTQVLPDFYVIQTQNQFSQYFASLIISRTSTNPPTYQVNVITNSGAKFQATVAT